MTGAFSNMLAKKSVRQALTRPVLAAGETVDVWREREFAAVVNSRIVNGTFDRVIVISRDGIPVRATVIDIKTTRLKEQEAREVAEKYRDQMEAYRGALGAMLKLPLSAISCLILFPADDQLVELVRD